LLASCTTEPLQTAPNLVVAVETEQVADDPDDPAIWIHPRDRSLSLVVGTNKVQAPAGALVVFDLQGRILQTIGNLDRPNNVDIEQGVRLGTSVVDIVAVTERNAHAVRLFTIDADSRRLTEAGTLKVFDGEAAEFAEPMGIAIYKRGDGAVFLVLGRKSGPATGYLWQYRLEPGPSLRLVRKFGDFSGSGEIEAVAVDDTLGYVYYADEGAGIRKYHADPDVPEAQHQLAFFGRSGYRGDREGIAIYARTETSGFIVSTDQIEGGSRYLLYRREGKAESPHDHDEVVGVLEGPADETDGIEVVSASLSPVFPHGLLAAMNSGPRTFLLFSWPRQWAGEGASK
jgi:3-phytase